MLMILDKKVLNVRSCS